ncbi:unnamed protein product [Symbiodinium sp. KB8]|nr:unnamed protein product [Symbiodinium sp. KB8]
MEFSRLLARSMKQPACVAIPLSLGAIALMGSLELLWQVEVPNTLEYGLLSEDSRLDRFSKHCLAEVALAEESVDLQPADWKLQSALVMASHGEASARQGWPDDPRPPSTWDCRPTDLPRHWHLNQQVHFQAVAEDGSALDRSFEPDLLAEGEGGDTGEPWAGRSCAAQQLTSDGFKQAVLLGRRLQWQYHERLAEAALDVLSVDTRRSLATALGILLPLASDVGEGATMSITTLESSETLTSLSGEIESALEDMQFGADLLSRWCNHGSLPCNADGCLSPKAAAELIAKGELQACQALLSDSSLAFQLADRLQQTVLSPKGRLSVLSVSGIDLTASLVQLLGREACEDALMARPPWSSSLVFERFRSNRSQALWRVLWNGLDITQRLGGCDLQSDGCLEESFFSLLKDKKWGDKARRYTAKSHHGRMTPQQRRSRLPQSIWMLVFLCPVVC